MDILASLSRSPLFDMLANQELEAMGQLAEQHRFAAEELIFEEGEAGDCVYVIVTGEVQVEHVDPSGTRRYLAQLSAPDFFGEMGLLDKVYRSATVRAKADTELLRITTDKLAEFRGTYPDGYTLIILNIARALATRLREANDRLGPLPGKGSL